MGALLVIFWPLVKLVVGVKLGACAKIISVGDGFVGEVDKATAGDSDEKNAGEGDISAVVGDGDGVGVCEGDKAAIGLTVGAFVGVFGLRVDVGKTTIVGLIEA